MKKLKMSLAKSGNIADCMCCCIGTCDCISRMISSGQNERRDLREPKEVKVTYLTMPQDREKNRKEISSKVEPKTSFVTNSNKKSNKHEDILPELAFFIGVGIGVILGAGLLLAVLNLK